MNSIWLRKSSVSLQFCAILSGANWTFILGRPVYWETSIFIVIFRFCTFLGVMKMHLMTVAWRLQVHWCCLSHLTRSHPVCRNLLEDGFKILLKTARKRIKGPARTEAVVSLKEHRSYSRSQAATISDIYRLRDAPLHLCYETPPETGNTGRISWNNKQCQTIYTVTVDQNQTW